MRARVAGAWLIGVCLAATAAGASRANEAAVPAQVPFDLALPEPPLVEVVVAPQADPTAITGSLPEGMALRPTRGPEGEPPVSGAAGKSQATADVTSRDLPVVDLPPPDVPPVIVQIPTADIAKAMIAERLAKGEALAQARLGKREREAVGAFYAGRGYAPLWLDGEQWNARARHVMAQIERAAEDGLDPADYPLPTVDVLPKAERQAALADAELKLSAAAVAYARDARGGRIEPPRLSKLITPKLDLPSAEAVLAGLAESTDAAAALAAYNPPHAGYRALKEKLAEIRAARPSQPVPMVRVPAGPALKIGMRDPRVPLIRARFGLGPDPHGEHDDTTYDEKVAAAVASFQKQNGLPASGVLTRQTVAMLAAGAPASRAEGTIIANMERWRWLPAELGERHVFVDIPAYTLRLVRDGETVHSARVIVGKPESPTPIFSDVMEHLIVNPYWHVPPSILKKEFLPQLAVDPDYATRRGYEVIRRGNSISVRQPPGERNALGNIKFMFPNEHAVYLHDTPGRHLFRSERRAMSHGCVRVDQPFRFAELVLAEEGGWSEERVRKLVGGKERFIKLGHPLPVHLTYFTAVVGTDGELQTRDDIYGVDARVKAALGLR
ncbi:L,D-transpeptidase family protein [Chelatococcus sp. SYSU_G07232]|uniref:L,D-transpeptidase family protein n=1 Tax=Chelatococcus albus TaxID=3047466 RepID=A0ABT7AG07_9HYPH|nr:L,D-transpeptidase family protein [Chelatococcus sp. SYSU_G07232]MDJ1158293.1 L,D-transpeptidase family protein [Chelatococcus sp. SYSU_G07232]